MEPWTFTLAGKELEEAAAWQLTHPCTTTQPRIIGAPDPDRYLFGYNYTFSDCNVGRAVTIFCQTLPSVQKCHRLRGVVDRKGLGEGARGDRQGHNSILWPVEAIEKFCFPGSPPCQRSIRRAKKRGWRRS